MSSEGNDERCKRGRKRLRSAFSGEHKQRTAGKGRISKPRKARPREKNNSTPGKLEERRSSIVPKKQGGGGGGGGVGGGGGGGGGCGGGGGGGGGLVVVCGGGWGGISSSHFL